MRMWFENLKKFSSNILSFSTLRVFFHHNLLSKVNLCTITDNVFLLISFAVSFYLILKSILLSLFFLSYLFCDESFHFVGSHHTSFLKFKAVLIMISSSSFFFSHECPDLLITLLHLFLYILPLIVSFI